MYGLVEHWFRRLPYLKIKAQPCPRDCPEQLSGTPQIVKTLSMLFEVRRRELDLASNEII
jgi:hypothetical protein